MFCAMSEVLIEDSCTVYRPAVQVQLFPYLAPERLH